MKSGKLASAAVALGSMVTLYCVTTPVFAWGDEGHEIVGLIAQHYLDPAVATKVNTMLAADTTGLTSNKNIDMEATWADHYRRAQHGQLRPDTLLALRRPGDLGSSGHDEGLQQRAALNGAPAFPGIAERLRGGQDQ